jgi:hypothetical protein
MSRNTHLMPALLVIVLLSSVASSQKLDTHSLMDILSKQGFTGQLHGNVKVKFARLGVIKCNAKMLQVYYYTGEETNPPGRAIHFSQRLIFIQNRRYIGQYVIADRPNLFKQQSLRFPYSKNGGDTLQCDQAGLPESVHLDGQVILLER